jgi:ATP-dependent Clp protease ATP-binding subunit ClpC
MLENVEQKERIDINIGDIIDLRIEDLFNYVEEHNGEFEILTNNGYEKIGDLYKKTNKKMFNLELSNGFNLLGSSDHLVLVDTTKQSDSEINDNVEILDNNTWIRLSNIKTTDWVVTIDGSFKVSNITFEGIDDTYDLEVLSDEHAYISNNIVSHNTGKSSIAEGLAIRIAQKKVSRLLFNKRIILLDMASMVSGTKYRGQFEERIKALVKELEKNKDIILFIDEIHTIIGAGGASGSLDASNMLKPAMAKGEVQIIGATTLDEYRKHIEQDGALARRFQKVMIEPTTVDETIQILTNIKERYEDHHNVILSDDIIENCVKLTDRYITDRHLPDKAIDAMDEVGAMVHISNINVPKIIKDIEKKISDVKEQKKEVIKLQKYEEAAKLRDEEKKLNDSLEKEKAKWEKESSNNKKAVTFEDLASVISMMCGIPVNKISESENKKLNNMFETISSKVVGQDGAIKKMVSAIQRGRVGMKDPNKPLLSAMLIGNSGTGKTELAKQLARFMFDSDDALIRIDMSEYTDKISVNRIIGSPSGYVGYEDSTILDKIRNKPYSVILFDEIEKAHPEVYNIFLQMLDDGHMTDSHGRKVSFKNCVILMTSNVGTRVVKEFGTGIGFSTKTSKENQDEINQKTLEKELKKKFAPEFINRIDEIIYFRDLGKEEILKIVDIELEKSIRRSIEIGYEAIPDDSIKEKLFEVGFQPEYGARPLKRAIQRWFDDSITGFIIENSPKEGTKLYLSYDKETDKVIVKTTKPRNKK